MTEEQANEMLASLRTIAETNAWSVDRAKRVDFINDVNREIGSALAVLTESVMAAGSRDDAREAVEELVVDMMNASTRFKSRIQREAVPE